MGAKNTQWSTDENFAKLKSTMNSIEKDQGAF